MPAKPPLPNFCFCGTLQIGGVVIGALQAGYYAITLIGVAVLLGITNEVQDAMVEIAKEEGEDHEPYEAFGKISAGILWPVIVLRTFGIVTSVLLIVGTQKRNKHFLMPYMIYEGIAIGALVLLWFLAVPGKRSGVDGFVFFLILTLYILLNKYFWMCVLSLYIMLSNEQSSDINNGQAMIPLQTIPENQRVYVPPNSAYPLQQQQPLYIPQPVNSYQNVYGQPPAYPVQTYHLPEPEKV